MNLRAMVFGPAYLDRVLRVDQPLVAPALGPPIDQSVDGALGFAGGRNLELADPAGYTIEITLPPGWPGPSGRIELEREIRAGVTGRRAVSGLSWTDDLGGMGPVMRPLWRERSAVRSGPKTTRSARWSADSWTGRRSRTPRSGYLTVVPTGPCS